MNIFFLEKDPRLCAQAHVDRHVVKMILESSQLLETAHIVNNSVTPYHTGTIGWKNHKCAVWVRESRANYEWLCDLGVELCKEYTNRYGKIHSYVERFSWYKNNVPNIPDIGMTTPAMAIEKSCIIEGDPIGSYRKYYNTCKRHLFNWKSGIIPEWVAI